MVTGVFIVARVNKDHRSSHQGPGGIGQLVTRSTHHIWWFDL